MRTTFSVSIIFLLLACLQNLQAQDKTDPKQQYASLGDFTLGSGLKIYDCKIGYQTYGKLNAERSNAIIFLVWFGGNSRDMHEAISGIMNDTAKFYFILIDAIGNGYSSSPSNSIKQAGLQFPVFTIRDMVESQYTMLTEKMNIHHLVGVTGFSMGGLQAFQWAVSHPDFIDKIIPIVGTPQPTSSDLLWMNIQSEAIKNDTAYHDGNYKGQPVLITASHINQLILTTPENVTNRVSRDSFYTWFASAEKPPDFDWNNQIRQLEAIMSHDITKTTNGSFEEAAKMVKAKMLIIVSKHDHAVNPMPATKFAGLINAKLITLESDCGHGAPMLCESEKVNNALHDFLKE
jgi:homoserine O-acetyltransferase